MIFDWLAGLEGIASTAALIALLWQLRLVLRQMRYGAVMHLFEVNRTLVGRALDDAELLDAMTGQKGEVSLKDRLFIQQWFNQMHLTFLGKRNRFLPRSMHASLMADMGDFVSKPQIREAWKASATFYPDDFRKFMTELMEKSDA